VHSSGRIDHGILDSAYATTVHDLLTIAVVVAIWGRGKVAHIAPVGEGLAHIHIGFAFHVRDHAVGSPQEVLKEDYREKAAAKHKQDVEDEGKESKTSAQARHTEVLPDDQVWLDGVRYLEPAALELLAYLSDFEAQGEEVQEQPGDSGEVETFESPLLTLHGPECDDSNDHLIHAAIVPH